MGMWMMIDIRTWTLFSTRSTLILPTHANVLREQTQYRKQTRERPAASYFIKQLISIRAALRPILLIMIDIARPAINLHQAIDHAVKVLILVQRKAIPSNEPPSLQVPRKFMKNLFHPAYIVRQPIHFC